MQQRRLIDPEFNTTSLHITDGFRQVKGNRSGLGAWHKPARPKLFTEPADLAHHIGCSNSHVKAIPVFFNSLDQIVETHKICTRCLRFVGFLALGEDQDLYLFTGTSGQHGYTAYHLVSVTGINAKPHMDFNGWVKFDVIHFLEE